MGKGRPAQFRNASEKQKAYRERKKQHLAAMEALRKSEWENSIEGLAEKVDQASYAYDRHQSDFPTHNADDVPEWSREVRRLLDVWWEAQGKWYKAWVAGGYPMDKKPKSSKW